MHNNPPSDSFEKAFNKSLRFLSFRPRSEKEISDYLLKKNFSQTIIPDVLSKLRDLKFVDDLDFAKRWVEVRQKEKNKSRFVIKMELSQKGIDEEIVEKVIEKSQDDFQIAKEVYERKKDRLNHLSKEEFEKKIIPFLQRKGFSWDIIKRLIKNEEI
ncbi:MAG: hypothetical protein COU27_03370 [Candidatus Levybacteria bacterium CG10_big_fil_rev_8_21_14_0_10_36_7]|nr:MAG: hypothetical protein COU27_03370 [Candidatus Levybacteria bacterium CG10_big_fil_rev_8_21_14_0_10_36_7]